ncbi:unnamed protein product [Owenia fusiformis]|uniref:Tubulin polyglutamylase TTLL7 n=1 Tax=Owenia fusiformis TaxID=6347 RepID=A0A8S4N4H5_OWEFU|nr:unnamed protein product [Owenia fusiformis]
MPSLSRNTNYSVGSLAQERESPRQISQLSHHSHREAANDRARSNKVALDEEEEEHIRALSQKKKAKKKKTPITVNLSGTRYDIVRQMCEANGITVGKDDDPNCYLIWNDSFVSTEKISDLKPFQRVNHFPGMGEICRKDCLARNMMKMAKVHPEEFDFVPKSWIFPSEYSAFQNYAKDLKKKKKHKTYIVKPANGAMGNGIQLFRNAEKIPQNDHIIVQEYIDKPFLVDGYKCDLRIYVLVTSCDPLRLFLYNDGLLRMGTEKYTHPTDSNIDTLFMHLTNYSVNKHSENYEKSGSVETGSKRSLKYFNDYLRKNDYDVRHMWTKITEMLVKTLVVAAPHVLHAYRMCRPGQVPGSDSVCFELLGFDVMLDRKLKPWLIEVNRSPSFGTDEKIDYEIKSGVIGDTIRLLNIKSSDRKKNMAAQKAEAQRRLLRPTKRAEMDMSELDKKRQNVERRKNELKDLLGRLRKESVREDFENRACGCFHRIFPSDDRLKREKMAKLVEDAFTVFLASRGTNMQGELRRTYNNKLREEDVLDMLAQCEADEMEGKTMASTRVRGPKPLIGMPTRVQESRKNNDSDDDSEDDSDDEPDEIATRNQKRAPSTLRTRPPSNISMRGGGVAQNGRPGSGKNANKDTNPPSLSRPTTVQSNQRSSSAMRPLNSRLSNGSARTTSVLEMTNKDEDDEAVKSTLLAINDMRIRFPGKTDEEADIILDKIHENWKFHKPRIASYWLVKLDSIKRRKVIDIVRSNIKAVLQRTYKCTDVDNLRLYRIFSRVFNRLLWSHGQGLWNCFSTASSASWETIFSKSSDVIDPLEMSCCRRIVQLCRDCLLIVYQFAADAKCASGTPSSSYATEDMKRRELKSWNPNQSVSQRYSMSYHGINGVGDS